MGIAIYTASEMQAAVNRLREEAEHNDVQPHCLAAELLEIARQNNDIEGMKFWRGVWIKIMSDEYIHSQKQIGPLPAPATPQAPKSKR